MPPLRSAVVTPDPELAARLARTTLELVNVPSVSRREAAIAAYVEAAMPWPPAWRDGETLWYRAATNGRPLVVLAGHLDTVPPQGNLPGRLDGGAVWGLGASDMKGGLAVMLELARALADRPSRAFDVAFLFFPREELPATENPLPALFDGLPDLGRADLAILLEPTDGAIQAGCLGHLQATVAVEGRSAHSARPWLGINAIELALERLAPIARVEPRDVEIDGLRFVEVLSLTEIHGGIAPNVIPDRVEATVSYRYAPDRTPDDAEAELHRLAGRLSVELVGNSPPGRVVVGSPLVARLARAGGFELEPKQAWTNVADFTTRGVDAVNLGPGKTATVHRPDEHVDVEALARTYEALERFLAEEA
jgi:succinyl-diaminopimelate desuccinylase